VPPGAVAIVWCIGKVRPSPGVTVIWPMPASCGPVPRGSQMGSGHRGRTQHAVESKREDRGGTGRSAPDPAARSRSQRSLQLDPIRPSSCSTSSPDASVAVAAARIALDRRAYADRGSRGLRESAPSD
jgi:hypothetical protein